MQRPPTPPLYRPTSNVPFHTHLATWSSREIGIFLSLQRCTHHARRFEENDITGSVILELGAEELKELGVTKVGERVRLLGAIRELKKRNSLSLAAVNGRGGRDSSNGGSTPASASSFASVQAQQQGGGHLRIASSSRRMQSDGLSAGQTNPDQYGAGSETQGLPPMLRSEYSDRDAPEPARPAHEHHNQTGSATLSRSRSGTGGSLKRLHATRPPPLHLHSSSHGQTGSTQGQADASSNGAGDQRLLADSTSTATTPRGLPTSAFSDMNGPGSNGSFGPSSTTPNARLQPGSGSSSESLNLAIAAPLGRSSSMRAREQAYPASINGGGSNVPGPQGATGRLRAPGPGPGSQGLSPPGSSSYLKRSPSPLPPSSTANPVPIGRRGSNEYMARPLPGLPPEDGTSVRPFEGGEDPEEVSRKASGGSMQSRATGASFGSNRSGGSEVRPATSSGALSIPSGPAHKRGGSTVTFSQPLGQRTSGTLSSADGRRTGSKRPSTDSSSNVHPYAASAPRTIRPHSPTKNSGSPTKARFDSARGSASDTRGDITPTYPTSSENRRWYNSPARSPNDEMAHIKGQRSWSDRWASEKSSTPTLSLEDVKRKLVKFILSEDDTSRTIDVEACQNGFEVLEKALRKFGKWRGIARGGPAGLGESESDTDERSCLDVDGWGVYLHKGEDAQPLTEAELLAVCYAPPTDPARQNGLYLRQMRILANRKDIGAIFGDIPPAVSLSPTSPIHSMTTSRDRDSPRTANSLRNTHQTHRASMVSVMSALGVPSNDNLPKPVSAQAPLPKSPSSGSFLANRGRKIHNFFGHRPPSEIISNHLYDYFPAAKRRDLEKTARNSMLRLNGKGDLDLSRNSVDSSRLSLDNNRLPSRFSIASSNSSHRMSRASSHKNVSTPPSAAIPKEGREIKPVPRVSISGDDGSELRPTFEEDERVSAQPSGAPLLPPFEHSEETISDSMPNFTSGLRHGLGHQDRRNSMRSNKSHRLSTISNRRKSRRISDAASLLTVDEITAEVENRRASVITFAESEEEAEETTDNFLAPGSIRLSRAYSPGLVPQEEGEVSDLEDSLEEEDEEEETDSEEEESEDEEEEEEREENDNHGKAVTSTGANRSIKWIKGALIGQGAFGKVYLGMDSQNGLLMAVKQVDLEMGGTGSEEKKQSMVSAMQQEIALLKNLQHENIVQYLDSSTDEHHLNIFLEYVPGGSVTALLNNYGAFEEALVKNFVRQILIGLEYLHERNIIHRDIKGANILVDNKGGVKISDFGISKKVGNNSFSHMRLNRASLQGSVFWMAPEVVKQTAYTKKADIWSVGCLVVEMLTGEHPWPDLTQMQAIFRIGSSARPSNPTDISSDAAVFLDGTFLIDYVQRPTASELLSQPFLRAG